jgi:hypothetical protein
MKHLFTFLSAILILNSSCATKEPTLKIGLVADPQYAHKPDAGKRYYKESLWKLEEAIDTFNYYNVDAVQTLGDIIDVEWGSFDSILPVYDKLNPDIENYHLLGNHDFAIDSAQMENLLEKLSMPNYYYSYSKEGWRFIVLDATDYSYYSNLLHKHDTNQVNSYYENTIDKSNNHRWNSAIGEEQQKWLKEELDRANFLNQRVILFSHLPIRPQDNPHNLWNDFEIINLLENRNNVMAFINGHNHSGGYVLKKGIHFITIFGMVETMNSSYGILEIYRDSLVLIGYGNQETLRLNLM